MKIELLNVDQLKRVQDLAYKTWPDTFKDILSKDQISYMLNWMYSMDMLESQARANHLFFILTNKGEDIGFMGLEPAYPNSESIKIHKLYVLPSAQGMGAGKRLFDQAVKCCLDMNYNHLVLNVNRFNKAVKFYQHLGFKIIKEEDIDIGEGYLMEDYVMEFDVLRETYELIN